MHFLIDADSAIYKAGCANETRRWYVEQDGFILADFQYKAEAIEFADGDEDVNFVMDKESGPVRDSLANIKSIMDRIVEHERCTSYEVFIGGKDNFRYDIDPNYKGTRDKNNKPIHEQQLRSYLQKVWGAEVVDGCEVDDVVSYKCVDNPVTNVIVSIDKDLDNTPGWHYNYDRDEVYFVTDEEADLNFYRQMLSGDYTDGIVGVKGLGKTKAMDILPYPLTAERLCGIVWKIYQEKGYDWQYFVDQGRLLWMWRKTNDLWVPPIPEPEENTDGPIEVRSGS